MNKAFAYCRVSTRTQDTKNQILEIERAGFKIDETITEYCSGSQAATSRKAFAAMLSTMRSGDTLIVTKIDRLGRNILDVKKTIDLLFTRGIKVHCLALQGVDLTSTSGSLIVSILGAIAEFEKDLLIERTKSGIERAKKQGKKLGRPRKLSNIQMTEILLKLQNGQSASSLSKEYKISRATIAGIKKKNTLF